MDTKRRAWIKSLSWRAVGIIILTSIAYAYTGSWKETGWITIIFHSSRLVLYYWHERIWERVRWGRLKHPLACLPVRKDLTPEDYAVIRRLLDEHRFSADEIEYHI